MQSVSDHLKCLNALGLAGRSNGFDIFQKNSKPLQSVFKPVQQQPSAELAQGNFGRVILVENAAPTSIIYRQKEIYALKIFKKRPSDAESQRIAIMVDFSNLMRERMINWPASLARYRAGYYFVPEQVFAVQMDAILDSTTLQNVIESLIVSPNIWARWMRNVITALAFLHQNGFIHRDVHSGNVMVPLNIDSPDSNAVLIDLDLACATNSDCVSQCLGPATPRSTPPDLWCESFLKPTPLPAQWQAGDIWAAAATFASCVARKNNFIALQLNYSSNRSNMTIENRQTECTAAKNVLNYNRVINDALLLLGQNSELYRLLKQMLEIEWSARPSASDCLARLDNLRQSLDSWSGSGDSIVSRASTDGSLASSDATVVDSYF